MPAVVAKPWFAPKRYGYGAVPVRWQGWAATTVFAVALGLDMALVRGWPRWVCGVVLIAILAGLAYAKTEGGLRWRWGKS